MSIEAFDAAQRLHAAATGRPSLRARYAPVLPPTDAVAVTLSGTGTGVQLQAATAAGATATGHGDQALQALADLGLTLSGAHRTLVVPDPATLDALAALAVEHATTPGLAEPAAVIGWWQTRAEHPGSGAVLVLADACRLRWILGVPPEWERSIETWAQWLNAPDTTPRGLLHLAALVSGGHTLPGLLDVHEADVRSWAFHLERTGAGRDWRSPDSHMEAALGLATRCDATELYESLRLRDPLVVSREAFTGTVLSGTVTDVDAKGNIEVTCPRLLCRLRPDTRVQGWIGAPHEVPATSAATATPQLRSAVLAAVSTTPGRDLVLTLRDAITRPKPPTVGDVLTLRPQAVDPKQQSNGRRQTKIRFQSGNHWLTSRRSPRPQRRDVPLDVVISAAED